MRFAPFFERICSALKLKSQRDLAETLGISRSSIYSAKKRDSVPPRWILKLSQEHGLNVNWLLTGEGDAPVYESSALTSVPMVEARLSAGGGSLEVGEDTIEMVPFRLDWLNSKGSADQMVMFEISGDSMEPVVHHGDTVLVDMSRKDIVNGKVYAVGVDDTVLLKRVKKDKDKITLISENKLYPPETLTEERNHSIRIIGRMIWSSREYI